MSQGGRVNMKRLKLSFIVVLLGLTLTGCGSVVDDVSSMNTSTDGHVSQAETESTLQQTRTLIDNMTVFFHVRSLTETDVVIDVCVRNDNDKALSVILVQELIPVIFTESGAEVVKLRNQGVTFVSPGDVVEVDSHETHVIETFEYTKPHTDSYNVKADIMFRLDNGQLAGVERKVDASI